MVLDFRRLLLVIQVQNQLVLRDDGVGLKDRVEGDVAAAHVEQPGDLVEGGEDGGVVTGLSEAASER